jgi:L-fuconolactonase
MIYDGHAYCFPDLRGDGGFARRQDFQRHLQFGIAQHFQPVWRRSDGAAADNSGLVDKDGGWSLGALKEADFRAGSHGRFEWTVDGEDYAKQYIPPSVVDMSYPAERVIAEMDYAGVDRALLHRTPYLGISNEFIANCVRSFPDRLQGLAYVEEWRVQTEPDASIEKLQRAIGALGLSGLQFLPDHLVLYGQNEDWDSEGFRPFWDAFARLGVPLFVTPNYSSLVGDTLETFLHGLRVVGRWMERYPDVPVVLTHGLGWRSFIDGDRLTIPDVVYDAAPTDNPNFHVQLLFAIFLGGLWEYPMLEVRPTMEQLVRRFGVDRLQWGTDIPMVMRFYTYKQNLAHMKRVSDFLDPSDVDMITGGNVARLMGV